MPLTSADSGVFAASTNRTRATFGRRAHARRPAPAAGMRRGRSCSAVLGSPLETGQAPTRFRSAGLDRGGPGAARRWGGADEVVGEGARGQQRPGEVDV